MRDLRSDSPATGLHVFLSAVVFSRLPPKQETNTPAPPTASAPLRPQGHKVTIKVCVVAAVSTVMLCRKFRVRARTAKQVFSGQRSLPYPASNVVERVSADVLYIEHALPQLLSGRR